MQLPDATHDTTLYDCEHFGADSSGFIELRILPMLNNVLATPTRLRHLRGQPGNSNVAANIPSAQNNGGMIFFIKAVSERERYPNQVALLIRHSRLTTYRCR